VAGGNFTHGFAARQFPLGHCQQGKRAAEPLTHSPIPPAKPAIFDIFMTHETHFQGFFRFLMVNEIIS